MAHSAKPGGSHAAAGVHGAGGCGGVAACGACATARAGAAHRRANADRKSRFGGAEAYRCIRASPGKARLAGRKAIAFEMRYADGKPERLPALANELVQANVDVIVTHAAQPIEAVRKATSTIPIVMATVGDALGAGYVASLARPGGNITGLTIFATEQSAKRLQLIKEFIPSLVRVAVLSNANASGHRLQLKEMEWLLRPWGSRCSRSGNASELDTSFQAAVQAHAQTVVTMDDPLDSIVNTGSSLLRWDDASR